MFNVGDKVQSSLGPVIILDEQDSYLILFRLRDLSFVKANWCEYSNNKLTWQSGEYYSDLTDLVEALR